jgi:hypothetical protein
MNVMTNTLITILFYTTFMPLHHYDLFFLFMTIIQLMIRFANILNICYSTYNIYACYRYG